MILLIDNFDSFVYNLARYFEELGRETRVVRNDSIDVAGIRRLRPDAVVLSPGPRDPERAGVSMSAARELAGEVPLLGVCLGHQAIAAAFGARIVRGAPVHGRVGLIRHDGSDVFDGLPNPLRAARYHSLIVSPEELPPELRVTATLEDGTSDDGTIMAFRHARFPIVGIQFHPESILTEDGHALLENFLRTALGTGSPHGARYAASSRVPRRA